MGFPEDAAKVALRAAFNNPQRAIEYLMDPSQMPAQEAAPPAGGIPQNPAAGGIPQNPAAGGIPPNPAAGAGAPAGMPEGIAAMLGDPNTMQMIAALQQRPDMLPQVLAEI